MSAGLAERVLALLLEAKAGPVSGQTIAEGLGVTRTAVWKAIETLRGEGYKIESAATRGYLLKEGLGTLRPAEVLASLSTKRFGRSLRIMEEVDSTNREAARWADQGASEGAVVSALCQTAGRGRLGRSWFGNPGDTLMLSVVLRPSTPLSELGLITYVAALSLARTLTQWVDQEAVEIKWPNDVLLRGRKVAGILLESRIEGGVADHVITGVGVNVRGVRENFPEEFAGLATTLELEAAGPLPSTLEVLSLFLLNFETDYDAFISGGFGAVKPGFDGFFRMAGKEVRVTTGDRIISGRVDSVDPKGTLVILTKEGEARIHAGDVQLATTKG